MKRKSLSGITHMGSSVLYKDPPIHSPLKLQNRVEIDVFGPDETGMIVCKDHREHWGNVLCTFGVNKLMSHLGQASSTTFAWVSQAAIGTSTSAVANWSQDSLGASTASVAMGAGMTVAASLPRSVQYQMTFSGNQTGSLAEIGLFGSNSVIASMIAHQTFASVLKASNDTVQISYTIVGVSA